MRGYELARIFHGNPQLAAALLIALTGYGHEEACQASREPGINELLRSLFAPLLYSSCLRTGTNPDGLPVQTGATNTTCRTTCIGSNSFSQKKNKILKIKQFCSIVLLTQRVRHLIALIYRSSNSPGIKFASHVGN